MKKRTRQTILTAIIVAVLVALLLLWQCEAFSIGDTDVNATLTTLGCYQKFV